MVSGRRAEVQGHGLENMDKKECWGEGKAESVVGRESVCVGEKEGGRVRARVRECVRIQV
jgi:hypothetical protein